MKTIGEALDERDARLLRDYLSQPWFDDDETEVGDDLADHGNCGGSDSPMG